MAGEWRSSTIGELCDTGVVELQTEPFVILSLRSWELTHDQDGCGSSHLVEGMWSGLWADFLE